MPELTFINANVITPEATLPHCDLAVSGGAIASLEASRAPAPTHAIDASGCYLLPGIVDLHTDALENEIMPRPGANFPVEVALQELETKMLACGITTIYHSLPLRFDTPQQRRKARRSRRQIVESLLAFAQRRARANTRLHLRFEIAGQADTETLQELIDRRVVDLLSFMDHTPGQGQYGAETFLRNQIENGFTEEQAEQELRRRQQVPRLSSAEIARLAARARDAGIPIASHDDDAPEKVDRNHALGIRISEFPINLETARHAKRRGLAVLGGASNILRGGSLTGNLCMTEAVRQGVLDGLCSDYYPPSILHSVFKLVDEGILPLHEAVNMASRNPARAAGIADRTGGIEIGKQADLIVVRLDRGIPRVALAFVAGRLVFAAEPLGRLPLHIALAPSNQSEKLDHYANA